MDALYTIAVIAFLGALSPGPDFIAVSKNAIGRTRMAGVLTALGIGTGILIHSTYCILGLGLVIAHSQHLFSAIRYIGATYLIYLGIRGLLFKSPEKNTSDKNPKMPVSNWSSFQEGLLVNVLNPKCILFMLSIFTTVIGPRTPLSLQAIYGLELATIVTLWFSILSFLLTHRRCAKPIGNARNTLSKVMGAFLVGLGINLIVSIHS